MYSSARRFATRYQSAEAQKRCNSADARQIEVIQFENFKSVDDNRSLKAETTTRTMSKSLYLAAKIGQSTIGQRK